MKKYCIYNAEKMTFKEIIDEFRANGFNVTEEAIEHNVKAHYADLKSGYLDKENGYFLYTPCGCNPLNIYVEELNGEYYQKTYKA